MCVPAFEPAHRDITWRNERLERTGSTQEEHCVKMDRFDCKPKNVTKTVTVNKKVPYTEPSQQQLCRMVKQETAGSTQQVPVTRVVYK